MLVSCPARPVRLPRHFCLRFGVSKRRLMLVHRITVGFSPIYFLFVSHLRSMGLNVLGYLSLLLQSCHPACGDEGSSHLSPVLALHDFLSRRKFNTFTTRQPMVDFYLLFRYGRDKFWFPQESNSRFPH